MAAPSQRILVRDLYSRQRTGILLTGKHPAPNSPVIDPVMPHHGDLDLFWDEANLHTVSKACHDGEMRRQEQAEPIIS